MTELPENWSWSTIGEVCHKPQYGWTSKSSPEGKVKYLRTTDLSSGKVDWETVPFCLDAPDDIKKYQLVNDDIVVSRAGSIGLSYRIENPPKSSVFASYLIRLRASLIEPKYLEYFLKSSEYWKQISDVAAGIAVQNINATKLSDLKIPITALVEQKRIVAKLDKLFAHIDQLQNRLENIPTIIERFRQAVLTKAVNGKLTAHWRGDEKLGTWKYQLAQECCEKVQSGGTPKGSSFDLSGIPFLKVYNIVNQEVDFDYKPQFVSEDIQNSELRKSIAFPGDVLMNIVGPPLGKVAIIPNQYPEWNLNQAITLFRPKKYLDNKFLYYFLCEGTSLHSVIKETRGMVGQVNISLSQCRNFRIPIPPLEEQHEIVKQIEVLFSSSHQIESMYALLKQKIEEIPKATLSKAFEGKLIDPDSIDV